LVSQGKAFISGDQASGMCLRTRTHYLTRANNS
jgi:hypothetical protein